MIKVFTFVLLFDIMNVRHNLILAINAVCLFIFIDKNTGSNLAYSFIAKIVSQQSSRVFFVRGFGCALFYFSEVEKFTKK